MTDTTTPQPRTTRDAASSDVSVTLDKDALAELIHLRQIFDAQEHGRERLALLAVSTQSS